jgi:hypothetical protein
MEQQQRRRTSRFPFDAAVEIFVDGSDAKRNARAKELSLYGCYVDLAEPLSVGAIVSLKIFAKTDFFESRAAVIYVNPNAGMGLSFRDVRPHFVSVLRKWLLTAMLRKSKSTSQTVTE